MSDFRIIISGTSGSGKTSVVRELRKAEKLRHARAVTTRDARSDDDGEYEYITVDHFIGLRNDGLLLTDVEYRSRHYGVTHEEVTAIHSAGSTPILTITPESAARLLAEAQGNVDYLSIFIDAADEDLDRRLQTRGGVSDHNGIRKQREADRKYRAQFSFVIDNRDLQHTLQFIDHIVKAKDRSGVLTSRILQMGIRCGVYLENGIEESVQGASYDLRLGDEYFYGGKIRHLSERDPILLVEPYDYAIVTSSEIGNLPRNACGRFDLAVSLFTQGVILSNGPQIDPGFRGPLFCLLFNTSSSPVLLKKGSHYATLEIHQLIEEAPAYDGKYQKKTLLDYLPLNASRGAINELKKEVEDLRNQSKTLQTVILGVISIFMAIIALWVSLK